MLAILSETFGSSGPQVRRESDGAACRGRPGGVERGSNDGWGATQYIKTGWW